VQLIVNEIYPGVSRSINKKAIDAASFKFFISLIGIILLDVIFE